MHVTTGNALEMTRLIAVNDLWRGKKCLQKMFCCPLELVYTGKSVVNDQQIKSTIKHTNDTVLCLLHNKTNRFRRYSISWCVTLLKPIKEIKWFTKIIRFIDGFNQDPVKLEY